MVPSLVQIGNVTVIIGNDPVYNINDGVAYFDKTNVIERRIEKEIIPPKSGKYLFLVSKINGYHFGIASLQVIKAN